MDDAGHCEEAMPTQQSSFAPMGSNGLDCFASLAMTERVPGILISGTSYYPTKSIAGASSTPAFCIA